MSPELTSISSNLSGSRKVKTGDVYLTTGDIQNRYKISKPTQCRWRREGGGPPFVKLKGKVLYPESLFDAWMQTKLVGSTAELDLDVYYAERYKHLPNAREKAIQARTALKISSEQSDGDALTI